MQVTFEQVDSTEKEETLITAQSKTEDIKAAIELLEGGKRKIPLIQNGETILLETSLFTATVSYIRCSYYCCHIHIRYDNATKLQIFPDTAARMYGILLRITEYSHLVISH